MDAAPYWPHNAFETHVLKELLGLPAGQEGKTLKQLYDSYPEKDKTKRTYVSLSEATAKLIKQGAITSLRSDNYKVFRLDEEEARPFFIQLIPVLCPHLNKAAHKKLCSISVFNDMEKKIRDKK